MGIGREKEKFFGVNCPHHKTEKEETVEVNLTFTDKEANLKLDQVLTLLNQLLDQDSDRKEAAKLTKDVEAQTIALSGAIPKAQ
jgi:hypothetical protein